MRFVDDDRETLAGKLANLVRNHREFLQRRDNDRFPGFERLLELAGGGVDVLDDAEGLLELAHRRLQLAVEHAPVGHDDDRVEDAPIRRVVQCREPMREPGDREALATASGVLDQVALPGAVSESVGDEPAHAVELLVAREHQKPLAGFAPSVVLLLDLMDELPNQVEHAVARPGLLPEIGCGVTGPRRRHRRIAGPAKSPAIERQKARVRSRKMGRDIDQFRIHREMRQTAAIGKERLARVAVGFVLADRILDLLPRQRIFELGGENRNAIQKQH